MNHMTGMLQGQSSSATTFVVEIGCDSPGGAIDAALATLPAVFRGDRVRAGAFAELGAHIVARPPDCEGVAA